MEFVPFSEIKCPKSGIFTNNIGWGESVKVILQVCIAVFRAQSKNFLGKDGSAPLEKNWPVRLWLSRDIIIVHRWPTLDHYLRHYCTVLLLLLLYYCFFICRCELMGWGRLGS